MEELSPGGEGELGVMHGDCTSHNGGPLHHSDHLGGSTGVGCHRLLHLDAFSHSTIGIVSKIPFPQFSMFFPPSLLIKKFEASVFSNSSFVCVFSSS